MQPCGHEVYCNPCLTTSMQFESADVGLRCPQCREPIEAVERCAGGGVQEAVLFKVGESCDMQEYMRQKQYQYHVEVHIEQKKAVQKMKRHQKEAARKARDAAEAAYWDAQLLLLLSSSVQDVALACVWHTFVLAVLQADDYRGSKLPAPAKYAMNGCVMRGEHTDLPEEVAFLGRFVRLGAGAEYAVQREVLRCGLYHGCIQCI